MTRRFRMHGAEPFVSHSRYGAARSKAVLKKYPNHADRLARLTVEGRLQKHCLAPVRTDLKRRQDHD
ncbi:hypothetical protein [Pseudochrobactrum sp. MP213Fo]|uniref:hypothetical protein n=1 Tax=Pseudochrobactrum sp. MP213Fo TaxID=3022250 RepID=UPI003BA0371E